MAEPAQIVRKIVELVNSGTAFTDLHIMPDRPLLYRGANGYQAYDSNTISADEIDQFLSLPGMAGQAWKKDLDDMGGDLRIALTTSVARIRCNVYRTDGRRQLVRVVIRKLPLEAPTMQVLGLPQATLARITAERKGLFLIAGPTGAGKTTTLAAMLDHLNATRSAHIMTIERPIEYVLKQKRSIISQQEVPMNSPSFEKGVEDALQHDPDVIAIGEVTNRETVEALLGAANTGHLVFATTHTGSCFDTISRIVDFFDGADLKQKLHLIAATLTGVISQVLVPSTDGKSLVLAYEIMRVTPAIATAIRDNQIHKIVDIMEHGHGGEGSCLLNQTLNVLVRAGRISAEAAQYASYDREGLDKMVRRSS